MLLLLSRAAWSDPVVWRATAAESSELLLLGSVHYLRAEDHPLPEIVEHVYRRADALVMEIDLDDLDPLGVQTRFMQAALLPASSGLSSMLDDEVYALAETTAGRFGLDLVLFERVEPWLVAMTLMDLGMRQLGFSAEHGLEQSLLQRALRDRKPVYGLETVEHQIDVFNGLAANEQSALLAQTLTELDSSEREMNELVTAWRDGRLDTLADRLEASFEGFEGLYDALVLERNERWIAELERYAHEPGSHLVVVGALHLVGANNVVDMLRARGFEITRYAAP